MGPLGYGRAPKYVGGPGAPKSGGGPSPKSVGGPGASKSDGGPGPKFGGAWLSSACP